MLTSDIPRIITNMVRFPDDVADDAADLIIAAAKDKVPVVSGKLRDAIHADEEPEGVYVVAGNNVAWYGALVEYGTSHSAPRPFLIPAFEENVDEIQHRSRFRLRVITGDLAGRVRRLGATRGVG